MRTSPPHAGPYVQRSDACQTQPRRPPDQTIDGAPYANPQKQGIQKLNDAHRQGQGFTIREFNIKKCVKFANFEL